MRTSARQRRACRLAIALAGSIVLHAGALGVQGSDNGAAAALRTAQPVVLHALLTPIVPEQVPPASEPAAQQSGIANSSGAGESGSGLPSPDKWYKRSELDVLAEPLRVVTLDYPAAAKSRRTARVQVRLFIDERGVVRKTAIEVEGPERAFDEAAVHAWQDVRFSPAIKNGAAVKSQKVIELDFLPDLALR